MSKRFKKTYIEITNVCNLDCDFCPKTKRKPEFMSLELFKKAIKEDLSDEITLHIMGEPLLHPKIKKILDFAEEKDIRINLTTNGTIIQDYLLSKAIKRINFSIHGIIANFSEEKQEKHLKKIIELTKITEEKRKNMIIVYRLWNNRDVESTIKRIEKEFNTKIKERTGGMRIKDNVSIHFDDLFEWPNPKNRIRSETGYCHGLGTHIGILVDGTVVPCCLDNEGVISLGNIKDNTIAEILNTQRTKAMKKGFQERKLVENLCRRCTYIERFEK